MEKQSEWVNLKIKRHSKELLDTMLAAFKSKLAREGFSVSYYGLIDWLYKTHEPEIVKAFEERGLKIKQTVRLSEL